MPLVHGLGMLRLARQLGITTAEDLVQLVRQYYPDEQIPAEKVAQIRDIMRQVNAPNEP